MKTDPKPERQLRSFSELAQLDFRLEYLVASHTLDKPLKYYRCPRNQRRFDRLFYISEGEFHITQDGCETLVLHPGDLLYLPCGCGYVSEWVSEEISYYSAEFVLSERRNEEDAILGEPFSLSDNIFVALHESGTVTLELMRRLSAVWSKGELGYKLKAAALFMELLHHVVLENVQKTLETRHADISAAIFHLENNYIEDISVAELAKLGGMCESRFRARFLEYAGMPPIRYRNLLRVKKATELLESGDFTVGEVAELVGIPDVAYFNRVFRSFMNTSPSAYAAKRSGRN